MRFVKFRDLAERYGIVYTRKTIAKLENQGLFPRHAKLSENRCCWLDTEIERWVEARLAAREAEAREEAAVRAAAGPRPPGRPRKAWPAAAERQPAAQ